MKKPPSRLRTAAQFPVPFRSHALRDSTVKGRRSDEASWKGYDKLALQDVRPFARSRRRVERVIHTTNRRLRSCCLSSSLTRLHCRRRRRLSNQLLDLLLAQGLAKLLPPFRLLNNRRVEVDLAEEAVPPVGRQVPRELFIRRGNDPDELALLAADRVLVELNVSRYEGEEGVVAAFRDVLSRVPGSSSLTNDDVAGDDFLTCEKCKTDQRSAFCTT